MPRFDSGAAIEGPGTTKLPPIPEVVWKQPQETHLIDMHNNSATKFNKSTHTPEFTGKNDVEAQTLPIQETSPQVSGSGTDSLLENQTKSIPVQCLNDPKKQQHEIQLNEADMTTYDSGDDIISSPKITTSQIEERL